MLYYTEFFIGVMAMNYFQELYEKRNTSNLFEQEDTLLLEEFLASEIYSPEILRVSFERWTELPFYIKDSMPQEIKDIILDSEKYTNKQLEHLINSYLVTNAIRVLSAYDNCPIPLREKNPEKSPRHSLLSSMGKRALKILCEASTKEHFSKETVQLALKTSHKFLMDMNYYVSFDPERYFANLFLTDIKIADKNKVAFPILQLSEGCPHNCSHCEMDTQPDISHMPYPMWRSLYKDFSALYKLYEGVHEMYPQEEMTFIKAYFERFYANSDPALYHDPIINTDCGDVAHFLISESRPCFFLTRGPINDISQRAIAKASLYASDFRLSFVDTPKDKPRSLKMLQATLDLLKNIPYNTNMQIEYTHLRSGPTVDDSIFQGIPCNKYEIQALGRAQENYPASELEQVITETAFCIKPDGNICYYQFQPNKKTERVDVFSFMEILSKINKRSRS